MTDYRNGSPNSARARGAQIHHRPEKPQEHRLLVSYSARDRSGPSATTEEERTNRISDTAHISGHSSKRGFRDSTAILEDEGDTVGDLGSGSGSGVVKRQHTTCVLQAFVTSGSPGPADRTPGEDSNIDVSFAYGHDGVIDRRGHSYQRVLINDNARVHMGDQIIVNNNFHDMPVAVQKQLAEAQVKTNEETTDTFIAMTARVVALIQTVIRFLDLLQRFMSASALPAQIKFQTAIFEDAYGRLQTIDIRFIVDWSSFHYNLTRAFRNKSQRVANAQYRLCIKPQTDLIDPRHPPDFVDVFQAGHHVQMSVHFEWSEVSYKRCPRCGSNQECKKGRETLCRHCTFIYRGHVEDTPNIGHPEEDSLISRHARNDQISVDMRPARDLPGHFHRITISEQPDWIWPEDSSYELPAVPGAPFFRPSHYTLSAYKPLTGSVQSSYARYVLDRSQLIE